MKIAIEFSFTTKFFFGTFFDFIKKLNIAKNQLAFVQLSAGVCDND